MSATSTESESDAAGAKQVAMRANAVIDGLRWSLANELGDSGGFDNRDYYDTFGWPNRSNDGDWDADNYYALYLRNAYAYAVVAQKPKTTWRREPEVRDRADTDEETDLERKVQRLDREHDIWHYCHRVDRMAGIGRHGLLVIDYADTDKPEDFENEFTGVSNASGLDMINGFRVYPEPMIEDIEWGEPGSDRWGKPVEYQIDLGDDADAGTEDEENTTLRIHHSRVVDVPSRVLDDDETRARPRQEPVVNNILDIEKALGSTAELSYRAADYGLNVNLDPDKVDTSGDALDMMEEDLQDWYHGLQPFLRTTGAEVNRLGGEVKDPTGIVDNNVRAIATQTGIPQRVLEGASLGELASAEKDEDQYLGTISERQSQFAEPYIARAVIDHFRGHDVLPDPEGEWYDIYWPDLSELSEQQEAEVKQTRSATVENLQMVDPDLRGERAEMFVETGEFPERTDAGGSDRQEAPVDETDSDVQKTFQQTSNADLGASTTTTSNATRYAESDTVMLDGSRGVVLDVHTEDFELDESYEASEDAPKYVVGSEDGLDVVQASALESSDWTEDVPDADPEAVSSADPTSNAYHIATDPHDAAAFETAQNVVANGGLLASLGLRSNTTPGIGFRSWPPTWEESEVPARVIALRAWASMGGSFTGCMGEIGDAEICAAFKDEIYQTTRWR